MTALTESRLIDFKLRTDPRGDTLELPMGAAETIYENGFVGVDPAGYAKAFVPGDLFVGIATEEVDNSAGAAAAETVKMVVSGAIEHTLSGAALTDIGKPVYATDDGTIALTGHPDAYVGRIERYTAASTVLVRMRAPGEKPPNGVGSTELVVNGGESFLGLGAAGTGYHPSGLKMTAIGAAGAPVVAQLAAEDGGVQLAFSATAEVQTAALHALNDTFPVDKAVTLEAKVTVHDNGDTADGDLDVGLGTALTANSLADISHADMVQLAAFHYDGNDENIDCQSDDDTTDVAPVDSTVDNVADTYHWLKIVVRPTGAVEFWIDGVRVLSATTFAVLSTANLGAFANLAKGANDTPGAVYIQYFRVAGGKAA